MSDKFKTLIYYFSITAIIIVHVIGIWLLFLSIFPIRVFEVKNPTNIQVDRERYMAGDEILLTFDYCKYVDVRPTVRKELINDTIILLSSEGRQLLTGCHTVKVPHVIPLNSPSGIYNIHIFLEYRVNLIRTVNYELWTEEFTIDNPVVGL